MNNLKDFFKKIRIDMILRTVLLIIMAVMFFVDPQNAMVSAAIVFSIFVLCDGVISMFVYFCSYGLSGFFGTTLLGSIFKILLGIFLLSYPGVSIVALGILFSIYVITVSYNTIEESIYLKRIDSSWVLPLILGILSLIGGISMLFMAPGNLIETMGIVAGITLSVAAIEDIIVIVDMYKAKKRVESNIIDIE